MITLDHVTKNYLNTSALNQVNLEFKKGSIVGIVGENGSGKSTTLKLIAGLLRPTKGKVLVDEKKANRLISRKVAYMSELESVYPFFTVGEAINYFESQFEDFNREKAEEVLKFLQLSDDQKVKNLSKGNKGRLKMTITLAREAPYILLDEPFAGLDPMVRNSIVKGLIRFIDLEKQALILTTHEIREIEPVLDEVVAIQNGNIIGREHVESIRDNQKDVVTWMEELYN
ncbi:ABC transporter ATP-binding protein [Pontibacillus yanchengensis]|uniref:Spermidine/putrescine ABC transporter ATP-binding protein n=1 Tax=Pontibacillus yanchengensis Y32 TaxID=1385514 RepID=A0A0A2TZ97_9BACI|nr:ABC transporter ATP-binding protein [Pontibacillus yanchengensis]KGP74595.1 spermidine/putrescine ABC transporter ATP-binding protein [Pontibacillus yanchengensis Y32]